MRIGSRDPDERPQRLKPPPDYSSRPVQIRLFMMVALLVLVITAAFEARKPERWRWLWDLTGEQFDDQPDDALNDDPIDPRLASIPDGPLPARDGDPALDASTDLSPTDRAWISGWQEVYDKLSFRERSVLYELLKAARDQQDASDTLAADAPAMLDSLDRYWLEHRNAAIAAVADLSDEEQAAWRPVVESLRVRWELQMRPLLTALTHREPLTDVQRNHLAGLQDLLDRLQLKAIQDNTVWRPSEREIWFRLFGKLQQKSPEELAAKSAGFTGYAQLFKQPDYYRGRLVAVRGVAEAVYPIEAPANSYGIERYWVYWLRPEGGPNNPIVVYALSKPEALPSIEFADVGRKRMPELADVEVTGYFFKRYAYQGQGGIFTAPLLLADEPVVIPSVFAMNEDIPSGPLLYVIVAALALFAVALATWVYFQYRPGRSRELTDRIELPPSD
jgi:hypothetical protein